MQAVIPKFKSNSFWNVFAKGFGPAAQQGLNNYMDINKWKLQKMLQEAENTRAEKETSRLEDEYYTSTKPTNELTLNRNTKLYSPEMIDAEAASKLAEYGSTASKFKLDQLGTDALQRPDFIDTYLKGYRYQYEKPSWERDVATGATAPDAQNPYQRSYAAGLEQPVVSLEGSKLDNAGKQTENASNRLDFELKSALYKDPRYQPAYINSIIEGLTATEKEAVLKQLQAEAGQNVYNLLNKPESKYALNTANWMTEDPSLQGQQANANVANTKANTAYTLASIAHLGDKNPVGDSTSGWYSLGFKTADEFRKYVYKRFNDDANRQLSAAKSDPAGAMGYKPLDFNTWLEGNLRYASPKEYKAWQDLVGIMPGPTSATISSGFKTTPEVFDFVDSAIAANGNDVRAAYQQFLNDRGTFVAQGDMTEEEAQAIDQMFALKLGDLKRIGGGR